MEIQVKPADDATILEVTGEIDGSSAPQLQEHIVALAQPGSKLLLDLSGVSFMSSAGLRVLLLLYRQISGGGGQVVLVGLSDALKDTMAATGFLKYFKTTDDIGAGLEALRQ
jgi:anti-sigma B factor antagonist